MSDANWSNIKEEKIEVIENMRKFCTEVGLEMPFIDERWRLDVLQDEFDKIKEQFWREASK